VCVKLLLQHISVVLCVSVSVLMFSCIVVVKLNALISLKCLRCPRGLSQRRKCPLLYLKKQELHLLKVRATMIIIRKGLGFFLNESEFKLVFHCIL